jgi:hypothetical protein
MLKHVYAPLVAQTHPEHSASWPLLSGADLKIGSFRSWSIFLFKHTGNPAMHSTSELGELPRSAIGFDEINDQNLEVVRENLYRHFRTSLGDYILIAPTTGEVHRNEFNKMLLRHQTAMGLAHMKIFLSHKSPDKTMVRGYKALLDTLGFDAWLDEESMPAGAQLDRSILQGMRDSCAAVFFITPKFADESYLATEINYAIQQHRERPTKFVIITLVFTENNIKPQVPDLLTPFVWKEPNSQVEAFREIIRSLPIRVGPVNWR